MMSALMLHNPAFASSLVTLDDLDRLPLPAPAGPRHTPVAHAVIVRELIGAVQARGYVLTAPPALGLSRDTMRIFGVLSLRAPADTSDDAVALGFRGSTDASLALKGVAGKHVFVCDNLALHGSEFVFRRKYTSGLSLALPAVIDAGIVRWESACGHQARYIARAQETELSPAWAQALMLRLGLEDALPWRLLPQVHEIWSKGATEDVAPRTLWGLQQAATRVIRELPPAPQFRASIGIGRTLQGWLTGAADDGAEDGSDA